ncbi:MAG: CPXCG motif-containing cysteine-rich protein [Gammaproteobacteria bacterium]|nr:CPXCG motif-containing cysteine-rich protein [Gammaproteobacteria bacterium]
MLEEVAVACPYCGARFTALVDCSVGDQAYVEDCRICCAPINFLVQVDERFELVRCELRRDDE